MIKYLILSLAVSFTIVSLAGCADDTKSSSSYESSTTTMSTDSKDMHHRDHDSH